MGLSDEAQQQPKQLETPAGFMTYAESYGNAAFIVSRALDAGARLIWSAPMEMLAMHCVELSLKAALMHSGITADELRKQYGHNLKGLFEASATFLDWSDFNLPDIEFYSDAVTSQALRYRTKAHFFVERDHILAFAEKTFHRCLQYVFPGAKRTLRI